MTENLAAAGDRPVVDYWSPEVQEKVLSIVGLVASEEAEIRSEMCWVLDTFAVSCQRSGSATWHQSAAQLLALVSDLVTTIGAAKPDPRRRLLHNIPADADATDDQGKGA
ncbi:hypothetical protein [Nocardioides zeae]